jgi:hypothetical protein
VDNLSPDEVAAVNSLSPNEVGDLIAKRVCSSLEAGASLKEASLTLAKGLAGMDETARNRHQCRHCRRVRPKIVD